MNEVVFKFLLEEDKFMPEMHLKQPEFTYRTCRPFTKNKERIQKFKETGDSRYIHRNKLHKFWFWLNMANGDFKDLTTRTDSDKIMHNKAFNIRKSSEHDGYQRGLTSVVYKSFDKKSKVSGFKSAICY